MSGIALVAHERGMNVSGSDMRASHSTAALRERGIAVAIGHDAANVPPGCDAVVISTAIPASNPELVAARERGIAVWHRSQMLAALGEGRKTLACAGTHGKTTSSSMLATTIERMGLSPSFVIGGQVDAYGTNAADGSGEYYIVEADESDGSFVHLQPHVALITNIEPDHLDHYGSLDAIYEAFGDFVSLLPDDGAAVVCGDDAAIARLVRSRGKRAIVYGPAGQEGVDVSYRVTGQSGIGHSFDVAFPDGQLVHTSISSNPGIHNVSNATGVLAVVWACGLDVERAAEALSTFSGVRRRFDIVGYAAGVTVVDDYAHHPTEIQATISAAAQLSFSHVHVLFQPHRYTRTQQLAEAFGSSFDAADSVTFMDVYAAGEAPIPGISGKTLVASTLAHDARAQVAWMPHRGEIAGYLAGKLHDGDVLITMGAGDVTGMGPIVLDALKGQRTA